MNNYNKLVYEYRFKSPDQKGVNQLDKLTSQCTIFLKFTDQCQKHIVAEQWSCLL